MTGCSDVQARLGLKALAWARLEGAQDHSNPEPSRQWGLWLGPAQAAACGMQNYILCTVASIIANKTASNPSQLLMSLHPPPLQAAGHPNFQPQTPLHHH